MCCSRSRCVPPLMAGVAVTITSGLFYCPSFSPLCDCCLKQQNLFARLAGENALLLDQNRLDEGNGPQSIKAKSLPKFWEIRFYHLAPKRTLNILQWDQTQPGHPWHLGNSDFPTLSWAGFGCETKAAQSIKGSIVNFCFTLIAFCLYYGQMSRASRHSAWDIQTK